MSLRIWLGIMGFFAAVAIFAAGVLFVETERRRTREDSPLRSEMPHPAANTEQASTKAIDKSDPEAGLTDELGPILEAKRRQELELQRMEPREKRVHFLKEEAKQSYGGVEKAFLDCWPDAPYLLCLETNPSFNTDLTLQEFRRILVRHFQVFKHRFGKLFELERLMAQETLKVYVFSSGQRYHEITGVDDSRIGFFHLLRQEACTYRDVPYLYECLFHECTHQLLFMASQVDVPVHKRQDVMGYPLNEGLAGYFELCRDETEPVLGRVSLDYLPLVQKLVKVGKNQKLAPMLDLSYDSFAMQRGRRGANYAYEISATAWAIVHFLENFQDGKYRQALDAYLALEFKGEGGAVGARKCFGDLEKLNAEWEKYIVGLK